MKKERSAMDSVNKWTINLVLMVLATFFLVIPFVMVFGLVFEIIYMEIFGLKMVRPITLSTTAAALLHGWLCFGKVIVGPLGLYGLAKFIAHRIDARRELEAIEAREWE